MTETNILAYALKEFAGIGAEGFALSLPYWQKKQYGKGEFYNEYKNVCKHLGFILDGVFRTYYIHDDTAEEKNVFFFTTKQVIVAYKSFVTQTPCNYYTQSLANSTIIYIHVKHLKELYQQSHEWERFGRLVAEAAFNIAMTRAEDFMFLTPEQRYLDLVEKHPNIFNTVPLYHIASYLGIQGPSLSRIRKRMIGK
ncbi:Crp/Fnr family transcriptional regulator [Dyadobacter arcticus]|uniref:CRP-like cAMP-binding protein n=1 Tax=Dyadobacter arcticus TaxID=1078754 RepID=A0ABX0UNV5_9BACT|nr:Crp/Fnr family transcriptional regulator [Dyadobacter arcticus]NIJ53165.1 CRP-like cAMP-binding protein [Dyadobacter arcticus]